MLYYFFLLALTRYDAIGSLCQLVEANTKSKTLYNIIVKKMLNFSLSTFSIYFQVGNVSRYVGNICRASDVAK